VADGERGHGGTMTADRAITATTNVTAI
jgi:hypothetical protein